MLGRRVCSDLIQTSNQKESKIKNNSSPIRQKLVKSISLVCNDSVTEWLIILPSVAVLRLEGPNGISKHVKSRWSCYVSTAHGIRQVESVQTQSPTLFYFFVEQRLCLTKKRTLIAVNCLDGDPTQCLFTLLLFQMTDKDTHSEEENVGLRTSLIDSEQRWTRRELTALDRALYKNTQTTKTPSRYLDFDYFWPLRNALATDF